jgi:hypothetical protein
MAQTTKKKKKKKPTQYVSFSQLRVYCLWKPFQNAIHSQPRVHTKHGSPTRGAPQATFVNCVYTMCSENRCALRLRNGYGSGLYLRSGTSLPTPFISSQRLSECAVLQKLHSYNDG